MCVRLAVNARRQFDSDPSMLPSLDGGTGDSASPGQPGRSLGPRSSRGTRQLSTRCSSEALSDSLSFSDLHSTGRPGTSFNPFVGGSVTCANAGDDIVKAVAIVAAAIVARADVFKKTRRPRSIRNLLLLHSLPDKCAERSWLGAHGDINPHLARPWTVVSNELALSWAGGIRAHRPQPASAAEMTSVRPAPTQAAIAAFEPSRRATIGSGLIEDRPIHILGVAEVLEAFAPPGATQDRAIQICAAHVGAEDLGAGEIGV